MWKQSNFCEFTSLPRRQHDLSSRRTLCKSISGPRRALQLCLLTFGLLYLDFPASQPLIARPVISYFGFCSYYQKIPWSQIKRSAVCSIIADRIGTAEGDAYFSRIKVLLPLGRGHVSEIMLCHGQRSCDGRIPFPKIPAKCLKDSFFSQ
jgi:hypothetical protein